MQILCHHVDYLSTLTKFDLDCEYQRRQHISPDIICDLIMPNLINIQQLEVYPTEYSRFVDRFLSQIGKIGRKLVQIRLNVDISVKRLAEIARQCPSLTHLTIRSTQLSDAHLEAIVTMNNLSVLDLTGCDNLTDRAIATLSRGCPHLRTLVLAGCWRLTDIAIEHVSDGCLIDAYHEPFEPFNEPSYLCSLLDIPVVKRDTSSLFDSLMSSFQELELLDLSHTAITNVGLGLLTDKCRRIRTLNTTGCTRLTRPAIDDLICSRRNEIDIICTADRTASPFPSSRTDLQLPIISIAI
jgi:hypothetical protein